MKVLHVEAGKYLYGGARQVQYLIEGLKQKGIDCVLACPEQSDIAKACENSAQVCEISMKGDLDFGLYSRLKKIIQQTQPDIVHLHSRRGADIWGALAARKMKVPCILSRRVDNPESQLTVKLKYALYQHVIAISEGIRQVLINEGLSPQKVTCVRSAVDAVPYLHAVDKAAFTKEFALPADALVLGVVAQLINRKGHRYLIDAMPAILERFPNTQVLFFGKGPQQEELSKLITERQLSQHIHFAGFRTDLPKWLGGLDVLVHPADMEGLGVSLLQAAAAGVPVIASRAGGMPEAVADRQTGMLIDVGNVVQLTSSLLELLGDSDLRLQYGQAGRQRILNEFSVEHMVDGNLSVYLNLINIYNKKT